MITRIQPEPISQPGPVKLRGTFELPECQVSTGVTRGLVNLRAGPGMHHPVLQVVPEAEALPFLGQAGSFEDGAWRQVRVEDQIGWIYAPLCKTAAEHEAVDDETWLRAPQTFLSVHPATPKEQTASDSCQIATGYPDGWANLHFGPGMGFHVVATLPERTHLERVEEAGDFYTNGIWYKSQDSHWSAQSGQRGNSSPLKFRCRWPQCGQVIGELEGVRSLLLDLDISSISARYPFTYMAIICARRTGIIETGMNIIYTHHAQQRMGQRKVRHEEVVETLEDPDEIVPGDNGGDMAIKRYGYREVRVVYAEPEEETFLIYTVMKTRIHHRK